MFNLEGVDLNEYFILHDEEVVVFLKYKKLNLYSVVFSNHSQYIINAIYGESLFPIDKLLPISFSESLQKEFNSIQLMEELTLMYPEILY